jgi:hypothetical protein
VKRILFLLIPLALLIKPNTAQAKAYPDPLPNEPLEIVQAYGPIYTPPIKVPAPKPIAVTTTSLKAPVKIPVDTLQNYLAGTPFVPYAAQLLESDYWSTIIGICTIEQYSCSRAPYNNYWGLMKPGGGLQRFATLSDGIAAIDAYLTRRFNAGRDTLEEFRGYYCVNTAYPGNVCPNWESTVKRVKLELENL